MSDTQHTPGPFTIEHQEDISEGNGYAWAIRGWQSEDAFQKPYVQNPAYANSEANAEFIVRACNSHDELVKALEYALADLEGIMPEYEPSGDREHPGWQTIKDIKAAIAKAKGGA